MAAGSDLRVFFYDVKGSILQKFDYSHDDKEKEYSSCEMSPSGQTVVVASFNRYIERKNRNNSLFRFRTFSYSTRRKQWEEDGLTEIENLYTITAVSWKKDGSRLVLGSLCGAIEMYDACLKYCCSFL
jgi:intraflagellar transport protein 172